jgi:hypothetical protein
MVEAIDRRANDRPATRLQGRHEVLCKSRLAGSVHAVDGDTNRMRPLDGRDAMSECIEEVDPFHCFSIIWARPLTLALTCCRKRKRSDAGGSQVQRFVGRPCAL